MLHVRFSQSLNFQVGAFTVLVFRTVVFLALIRSCRGQSRLVGPSQPVVATVGEDVILPCHLDPVMNAFDMTVEWARPDLDPRFVYVWRDGVELESKKHPSYKGRTSVFTDKLKLGDVSLNLLKVKISDEGTYRCFIPELGDSFVKLVVGVASSPVVQMTKNSSVVFLQCESKGWYPELELFWLDGEGNLLSAGPTETVRGPDDLYTVSSRVTVEKRHSNSFTCRVQQKDINQTRETQIHVPDDFFPDPSSSGSGSSAPSSTIIGVVVGILFILAVAAVVLVWKWRQNKIRNKKHHDDEEKPNVREKKKSNSTSNSSEQESLMDKEPDREQLTTERKTVNNPDKFKEETQTDGETRQRESNNVRIQTPGNIENHSVDKGTELQYSMEGERHTDQGLAEGETETGEEETKQTNERRDAPNPAESNTEQQKEERQTEHNLHTEEGQKETKTTGDKTQVQCLMKEEKRGEQLTAERETVNDVDKENETLVRKIKTKKERELKEFEKKASRIEGQMKQKEEQVKELKLQLEEVERQRGETQMKIHSVRCKLGEDEEEEVTEEEKDESTKRLSDTMNDLNKKKAELQKELQKKETQLEGMKKEEMVMREKIKSLTVSSEKTENLTDPVDSLTHKLTNVKL